jgi:hypothetical protein
MNSPITTDSTTISSSFSSSFKSISMEDKCMVSQPSIKALHHEKNKFVWQLDDDDEEEEEEEVASVPLWKYRQLEKDMQQMRHKMSTSIQKLEQQLDAITLQCATTSETKQLPADIPTTTSSKCTTTTSTTTSSTSPDSDSLTWRKLEHLEKRFALHEELLRLKTLSPSIEKEQQEEMMDFFLKEIEKTQISLENMMHLQSNSIQEMVEMDQKMINLQKETTFQNKKVYETLRQMEKEKFEAEELKKEQFELLIKQFYQKILQEIRCQQKKQMSKITKMIIENYDNSQENQFSLQEKDQKIVLLQKENSIFKNELENLQKQVTSQKKTQQILIEEILKIKSKIHLVNSNATTTTTTTPASIQPTSALSSSYHQLKNLSS